jgi:hypothetical protein
LSLIRKIEQKVLNCIAGVNIHFDQHDAMNISCVVLKEEKKKTRIIEHYSDLNSIEELSQKLDKKIPIWLSVTGRHVITRIMDTDPEDRYVQHVLPNAKEDDFVINVLDLPNEKTIFSAIRIEQFNSSITMLHNHGCAIMGYSLGPAPLVFLQDSKLLEEKEIDIPGYSLRFSEGTLDEIRVSQQHNLMNYSVGGEVVDKNLLLPFTLSLIYLVNRVGYDRHIGNSIPDDSEAFIGKRINRILAFASLGFIFLLLFINFLVFSLINSKYQNLTNELDYNKVFFAQKDSLQNEIVLKSGLVHQMGLEEQTQFGFYLDRIASIVPSSITLENLNINPVEEKIKAAEPILFQNYILIQGKSSGSIALNDFVDALRQFSWIQDVEILQYERKEHKGHFEIKLIY